jgi:hypothetical protein
MLAVFRGFARVPVMHRPGGKTYDYVEWRGPRHTVINAFKMAAIAADAGLTPDQFRDFL